MISSKSRPRVAFMISAAIILATARHSSSAPLDDEKSHETAQASTRIMKELMDIYKSESYKKGAFQVEPVGDNLYEWNVKLFFKESQSPMREDLQRIKEFGGEDHVLLRISFEGGYPVAPPFVRVIYPKLQEKNVSRNGSLCMYNLSREGWVSDYTMEGILLMIIELLESNNNRVDFLTGDKKRQEEYTAEKARATYEAQMKAHFWHRERPHNDPWYGHRPLV